MKEGTKITTTQDRQNTRTNAGQDVGVRVLQVGPLMPVVENAIGAQYDTKRLPEGEPQGEFLARHAKEVVVAVTSGKYGVNAELMASLPNLEAIVNFGVGYDGTDMVTARQRGIVVSNTPDVLNDCVADTAVALLLDTFRSISAADRFVRGGAWPEGNFPLTTRLSGKRIGIVGLGRIGRAIARRLDGFGCSISYHNQHPVKDLDLIHYESLEQLAADSDALIVSVAGGPSTANLISEDILNALGENGYLINVSRGSVVNEPALIGALVNREIAGAGLDVFADEPNVPEILLTLDNVVLLPHIASGTTETRAAMADLTLANLHQFLTEGTLQTPVP